MSDWADSVQFCIKRCIGREDKGARAGIAGILGFPNPEDGETAERCYQAAKKARDQAQAGRARRSKPPIPEGSTGNGEWDKSLGVKRQTQTA